MRIVCMAIKGSVLKDMNESSLIENPLEICLDNLLSFGITMTELS